MGDGWWRLSSSDFTVADAVMVWPLVESLFQFFIFFLALLSATRLAFAARPAGVNRSQHAQHLFP
jgi:hypothetical protein